MKKNGFTIIEICFVLLIAGIAIGLAFSTLHDWMERKQARQVLQQLMSALNYASSEAVKAGKNVTVCPTVDQQHCADTKDWSSGYMAAIISPETRVLRVYSLPQGKLRWQGGWHGVGLTYLPSGLLNNNGGSFYYAAPSQKPDTEIYKLTVSPVGRARLEMEGL